MAEEEKTPDVSEKSGKKRTIIIAAVAAIVVLAGVGGYAYASNSAYGSYESRVESAKESDSKLVKKIAEAQSLVKATKESDVLDKAVLDSLSKSVKTSETRKGIPDIGNVGRWNLWSVSKANASVSNDMTEANDSINAIGKAMGVDGIDMMDDDEAAKATIAAVKKLSADVGIPADLKGILKEEDVQFLAESAFADACCPGNPRDTSVEEIKELYRSMM